MRNTIVSPRFEEDAYKGQDIVHYGIRIPMQRPVQLTELSRRAQRIIKTPIDVDFKEMTDEDLPVLRMMWFDPADITFPDTMAEHRGIVAMMPLSGQIIGGAIWTPQGKNLFLHQLIASDWAKKELQLPTHLVWRSMQAFGMKEYHALDIGVSYNPGRYRFFKNFAVETYPIILKKPFYVPVIRLSPFRSIEQPQDEPNPEMKWKDEKATFFPRASYAIYGILKHLSERHGFGRHVIIVKTFGSDFISGCVTDAIEKAGWTWSLRKANGEDAIGAVLAIHEFGIPVFQDGDMEILQRARDNNVPIIEDCAWRDSQVWEWSDYQVFSLQKMMNINYGGLLAGIHLDDEYMWSIGCLDTFKRDRLRYEKPMDVGRNMRAYNWDLYDSLVRADGMTPDDCYNYAKAVHQEGWIPTVYLQKFESDEIADAIVARLEDFGIQAGRYWGEPVVYLPIHQNMSHEEVRYMFAVVRGYFNLCRDYK